MNNKIEITFSDYFSASDVDELNNQQIEDILITTKKFPKRDEATGGLAWEGIIIFIVGGIAGGFLGAIGQAGYDWLKEKLFNKKQKLQPKNIERFTINIQLNNVMVFFDFTDLNKEEFLDAMGKAHEALQRNEKAIKENSGWYDFHYDKKTKQWRIARSKSSDI